jgi:hypothetical protein
MVDIYSIIDGDHAYDYLLYHILIISCYSFFFNWSCFFGFGLLLKREDFAHCCINWYLENRTRAKIIDLNGLLPSIKGQSKEAQRQDE